MRPDGALKSSEWLVQPTGREQALEMIQGLHYTGSASNTHTHIFGLYEWGDLALRGVSWWIPPPMKCAVSVGGEDWRRVLCLSRLVADEGAPPNAESFLIGRSIRAIRKEGRWLKLVTFADTAEGHTGGIYHATNWHYEGLVRGGPRWIDGSGRRVSQKATRNRSVAEMRDLGYTKLPGMPLHKFTYAL